jgi:GNAT superfamily N-acetyltransferase
MKPPIVIRRAEAADPATLAGLLSALATEIGYGETYRGDADALLRHGFGVEPRFRALLVERAGKALGTALYFPEFSTQRGRAGVYVQDIYLRPGARSGGLGRKLLAAVLRDAAEWDAVYLRLVTHDDNAKALAFYARLGFRSDPRERPQMIEGTALEKLRKHA